MAEFGTAEEAKLLQVSMAVAKECPAVAKVGDKKWPRIMVHGVPDYVQDSEVAESIVIKNAGIFADLVTTENPHPDDLIKFRISPSSLRKDGKRSVVVEVAPRAYRTLRLQGVTKLRVDGAYCPIVDCIRPLMCNKCHGYNHKEAECSRSAKCAFCASEEHVAKDCKVLSHNYQCVNCIRSNEIRARHGVKAVEVNHPANDKTCPEYVKMLGRERQKYDYRR